MLRDVEFFQSRLGRIDGFGDAGEFLLGVINSKTVVGNASGSSLAVVDKIPSRAGSRAASPAPPPPPPQLGHSLSVNISTSPGIEVEEGKKSSESKEGSSEGGKSSAEEKKSPPLPAEEKE